MNFDADSTTVLAQTSPDGLTWSTFHDFDTTGFGFDSFAIDTGAGMFSDNKYAGDVASVTQVAVCESSR